ncbi:MAG TPA: methyltransferase domain-containing protein [archaeon]|nr:methyltransferase domain-containing protein [archaeon]
MKPPRVRALTLKRFPKDYQKYVIDERAMVLKLASRNKSVLHVGCGNGDEIHQMAVKFPIYLGLDIDQKLLNLAKKYISVYPNVSLTHGDAKHANQIFKPKSFDLTVCMFNTIGVTKEPEKVLRALRFVTKREIFFSVMAKGTLPRRRKYYESIKAKFKVDECAEKVYGVWGEARAYSPEELVAMTKKCGWTLKKIGSFANKLAYYVRAVPAT